MDNPNEGGTPTPNEPEGGQQQTVEGGEQQQQQEQPKYTPEQQKSFAMGERKATQSLQPQLEEKDNRIAELEGQLSQQQQANNQQFVSMEQFNALQNPTARKR